MIEKLLRFFRGYVIFEIFGAFPERFINICMHRGIFVFNISRENGFFAAMYLSDYRKIRTLAKKSGVHLRVRKRVGIPFLLAKYKNRRGLFVGLILFLVISISMQGFVWTVELKGVNTISSSAVLEFLESEGLKPGAFKNSLDTHRIERSLMSEFPEIGWMSVNLIGTKAEIEIKEKAVKPDIIDSKTPCNIKASHDGLVLSVLAENGSAEVEAGSAVIEGQLLISSAMVNALDEIDYVRARGKVMAQTVRQEKFTVMKNGVFKEPQAPIVRNNLIFCFFTFPITFETASGDYTSNILTEKLKLGGTTVEFGLKKEIIIRYENKEFSLSVDAAREMLKTEDYLYRLFALSNTDSITPKLKISETEDSYSLDVLYTCVEDIAKEEVFVVNQE